MKISTWLKKVVGVPYGVGTYGDTESGFGREVRHRVGDPINILRRERRNSSALLSTQHGTHESYLLACIAWFTQNNNTCSHTGILEHPRRKRHNGLHTSTLY